MRRKIFPTLLDKDERRSLAKLSTESGCSQSAVIRDLIHKEVAQPDTLLAKKCRQLILSLLRDKSFPHRALLLKEVQQFTKAHGR